MAIWRRSTSTWRRQAHNSCVLKRTPDLETLMTRGAIVFAISSLGGFALTVWPYFVWTEHYRFSQLALCGVLGFVPTLILAALATRRFGLPASVGFFACSLAMGVFLYVRLWQMMLAWEAQRIPQPDYPQAFLWLLPLAWVLLISATVAAASPVSTNDPSNS